MRKLLILAAFALTLSACGTQTLTIQGGSTTNGGVIPIAAAATYSYQLTFPSNRTGCAPTYSYAPPPGYYGIGGQYTAPPASTVYSPPQHFYLVSDSGKHDLLSDGVRSASSGSVYLTPGNWRAATPADGSDPASGDTSYPCAWSVVLTSNSN